MRAAPYGGRMVRSIEYERLSKNPGSLKRIHVDAE